MYRHLKQYLDNSAKPSSVDGWATLLSLAAWFGIFLATEKLLLSAAICLFLVFPILQSIFKNRAGRRRKGRSEWFTTLQEFAEKGQLESRSHPRMIGELEGCATAYAALHRAFESPQWQRLSANADWKRVRENCLSAAEEVLLDAIDASQPAFRPHGGKKKTFAQRCEDPDFAAGAIEAVRTCRIRLEHLVSEVSDEPFEGQGDALDRARLELQTLKQAEEELHRYIAGGNDGT